LVESPPVVGARPPALARRPSLLASLTGVVVRPAATFRDVALWPRWIGSLAVVVGAVLIITLAGLPFMWRILVEQFEAVGGPAEMKPLVLGVSLAGALAGAVLGPPFWAAILAVVMWGWAKIVDERHVPFVVAMAAAAHVGVIVVLRALAGTVLLALGYGADVVGLGMSPASKLGLGGLFDPTAMPAPIYGALAQVELFSIWMAVVIAVAGVHALGMRKGSAAAVAVLVWFLNAMLQFVGVAVTMLNSPAGGGPASF
jgi:hypothetical protein